MNRLKNHRFYLSGPIDDCLDLGATWRNHITEELKTRYNALVYDPLNKPVKIADESMREQRARWKELGEYSGLQEFMKQIRHVDLRMLDKSDALIVYLDMSKKMCGTWEEVFTGNHQHKPCLIVCPQGVTSIPDWLFGTIDPSLMTNCFSNLFNYLDYVDSSPDFDDLGRWLFFNQPETK